MIYDITPVPKPRMTKRDSSKSKANRIHGMRPAVARYFNFKDQVRLLKVKFPLAGARVIFHMPMPKSWSKKKKTNMNGLPHHQTPDLDNLLKALGDAVYSQDCEIWDVRVSKFWSDTGKIEIISNTRICKG